MISVFSLYMSQNCHLFHCCLKVGGVICLWSLTGKLRNKWNIIKDFLNRCLIFPPIGATWRRCQQWTRGLETLSSDSGASFALIMFIAIISDTSLGFSKQMRDAMFASRVLLCLLVNWTFCLWAKSFSIRCPIAMFFTAKCLCLKPLALHESILQPGSDYMFDGIQMMFEMLRWIFIYKICKLWLVIHTKNSFLRMLNQMVSFYTRIYTETKPRKF